MFLLLELLNVYVTKNGYDKELNLKASELSRSSSQSHIRDKEKFDNWFHFHPGSQISLRSLSLKLA